MRPVGAKRLPRCPEWLALSQDQAQNASFQPPRPTGAPAPGRQARSAALARLQAAPPDFAAASSSDLILFAREAVRILSHHNNNCDITYTGT